MRSGRVPRPDVVVETQNGVPYLAALWAGRTTHLVLVHHVHREQWPVVFGPLMARLGWFIESRVAPVVNRRRPYVAVSEVTRDELAELGVDRTRVRVVHNGAIPPPPHDVRRSPEPQLLVLGRLVPHKRVEVALEVLARLRGEFPTARLVVAGRGWWEEQVRAEVGRLGLADVVDLVGFVSAAERHRLLASSWVSLVPSVKEGWGLVVVEAGMHGTPTIAFAGTGGITESIVDGETGYLAAADDVADFTDLTRRLLLDGAERDRLGKAAEELASGFTWQRTVDRFDEAIGPQWPGARAGPAEPRAAPSRRQPRRSVRGAVRVDRLVGRERGRLERRVEPEAGEDSEHHRDENRDEDLRTHGAPGGAGHARGGCAGADRMLPDGTPRCRPRRTGAAACRHDERRDGRGEGRDIPGEDRGRGWVVACRGLGDDRTRQPAQTGDVVAGHPHRALGHRGPGDVGQHPADPERGEPRGGVRAAQRPAHRGRVRVLPGDGAGPVGVATTRSDGDDDRRSSSRAHGVRLGRPPFHGYRRTVSKGSTTTAPAPGPPRPPPRRRRGPRAGSHGARCAGDTPAEAGQRRHREQGHEGARRPGPRRREPSRATAQPAPTARRSSHGASSRAPSRSSPPPGHPATGPSAPPAR